MLANLFEMNFGSNEEWESFLLEHDIQHDAIFSALNGQNKQIIKFPLKYAEKDDKDWQINHQIEHEAIYSSIGLTGMPDLSSFDLEQQNDFNVWQQTHNDVHLFINNTLGI